MGKTRIIIAIVSIVATLGLVYWYWKKKQEEKPEEKLGPKKMNIDGIASSLVNKNKQDSNKVNNAPQYKEPNDSDTERAVTLALNLNKYNVPLNSDLSDKIKQLYKMGFYLGYDKQRKDPWSVYRLLDAPKDWTPNSVYIRKHYA
jgi:flagellar basal body-associated protein FliL